MLMDPNDPSITVGEAIVGEYTHVRAECCGSTDIPLRMMRVSKDDTLGQISARLRCSKCGKPAKTARYWRQSDAPGTIKRPGHTQ